MGKDWIEYKKGEQGKNGEGLDRVQEVKKKCRKKQGKDYE